MSQGDSEGFEDALGGLTTQRSVALSNKLTGVLSVSYTDSDIRDALRLLDQQQVNNTPDTRRQLRSNLQKEVIQCNASIIEEFGHVAEQLKTIGSTISSLRKCCEEMRRQVVAARQENAPILDEANPLLDQKQSLEKKKQLLEAFNSHFMLPEDDILTLTSTNQAIDDHFFAVLARMKQIHSDCRALLGSENQRLGLELMEQSSRNLNSGYQKLYRWIQREFMTLDLENPNINAFIRKSLRTLAERPALFESCLDDFSEARDSILTNGFYSALTGSSADQDRDSTMKPIEFYAHDALRYIGDMLAWAHSATVSERESLGSLFIAEGNEMAKGIQAGRHSEPWSAIDGESFDGRKALHNLVNRNMAGVARALRQRVEQAIQGQDDPITIYKIASLISFYRVTLTKLLGEASFIPEALTNLEATAMRQFEALQSDQIATVQAELTQAPSDLSVPDVLEETLTQLKALMKSYESSLTPVESRETAFNPVLAQTLRPILNTCETLSAALDVPAKEIFLLNCCLASKATLLPFTPFTKSMLEQMEDKIESSTASLVEYQHYFFLHVSALHPLLTALATLTESNDDLSQVHGLPPFQPAALAQAKQTLDDFLPSALMDALENLKELTDAKLAGDITSEAADRFCEDFEFVEGRLVAVDDLVEGEEEDGERSDGQEDDEDSSRQERTKDLAQLRSLYPRTSAEIRVLLS
ncbi:MAG: hypothetical protein Q9202_003524 [Teloschistes flavicans]